MPLITWIGSSPLCLSTLSSAQPQAKPGEDPSRLRRISRFSRGRLRVDFAAVIVPPATGGRPRSGRGAHGVVWQQQPHSALVRSFAAPSLLTLDYSERSAWTVLIRAARTAGTNDAKIAEATMTAADPINGSSPGSWSAGT